MWDEISGFGFWHAFLGLGLAKTARNAACFSLFVSSGCFCLLDWLFLESSSWLRVAYEEFLSYKRLVP